MVRLVEALPWVGASWSRKTSASMCWLEVWSSSERETWNLPSMRALEVTIVALSASTYYTGGQNVSETVHGPRVRTYISVDRLVR